MWAPKSLPTEKPKYLAIAEALEDDIRACRLKPGEKLPTQRDLADTLDINVSTVTRAYNEAERRGLIGGTVGRGTFVAADARVNRELVRPEERQSRLIEMGLVLPLYAYDPDIGERIGKLMTDHRLSDYTRYSAPAGLPAHRETGARWVRRFGMEVEPEGITVTAGAQHALACALASCFQPGDRLAVDALTYPGLKTLAGMLHIRLIPIAMDGLGMIPELLDTACRREPIRGVYLMPGVQNPTGASLPPDRRRELVKIIEEQHLLLIEDDAYGYAVRERQPALSSAVPDNSIYIAGLSKILFAGLRCAYVATGSRLRSLLAGAVLNTMWMAPTLTAAILSSCIDDGTVDRIMTLKLREAEARNLLARTDLGLPEEQEGDQRFFLWHELPEPWTGRAFEEMARTRGVNVFCAEKFAVGGDPVKAAVRFSLSGPETREELAAGLKSIAEILRSGPSPTNGVF